MNLFIDSTSSFIRDEELPVGPQNRRLARFMHGGT